MKVPNLKPLRNFFPFRMSMWKDFCQNAQYSAESRFVIGPIKWTVSGVYVCTFQPRNFTGWGSEGVNNDNNERKSKTGKSLWLHFLSQFTMRHWLTKRVMDMPVILEYNSSLSIYVYLSVYILIVLICLGLQNRRIKLQHLVPDCCKLWMSYDLSVREYFLFCFKVCEFVRDSPPQRWAVRTG